MKSKGSSSPSIQVERIWGQAGTAGETAIRGAGHGARMLLYSKMGKQGWAERRAEESREGKEEKGGQEHRAGKS
jgi:hypothetical protein